MAEPTTSSALVRNAGDPDQVKRAERHDKDRAKRFGETLKATLQHADGRALLWALIGRAKVNASVFSRDAVVMAYNSGRQDFGHELMAEIIGADASLYLRMEQEARDRDTRDEQAIDAAHVANADDTKEHT